MPLGSNVPDDLYKYFNSWQRLESRSRDNDFNEGLEARIADPLWFLSRQWQLGEFQAEDAGSLVSVEVRCRSEKITSFIQPGEKIIQLEDGSPPLEVLIEREPVTWDWRMRIRCGQQFERLLREVGNEKNIPETKINEFIGVLRAGECGIRRQDGDESDLATRYRVHLLAGGGINGEKLWNEINKNTLNDTNGQLDQAVIDEAVYRIKSWYRDLFCQPEEDHNLCWKPNTLDFSFGLKAPNGEEGETNLVSNFYRNGDLEWFTCNLKRDHKQGNLTEIKSKLPTPTRVSYGGMPLPRWWAMEDYAINFGEMDVAPTDLIKTLLAEFALVHGDDWFTVPLALRTGTINHIASVKTTDVFGKENIINPARANDNDPLQRWDLFSLAKNDSPMSNADSDFLYIPQSAGFREESEPLEEVRFIRDEGANMVWAVESAIPNGWGKAVSAFDLLSEKQRERESQETGGSTDKNESKAQKLVYQLASSVPANWIPFIPVRIKSTFDQIKLQRAKMPKADGEESPEPLTRILNGVNSSNQINEEAITRAGVKVQITKQRVRWIDGKTYVWLGRKVLTGKGEGSSGLVFDSVKK